MEQMKKNTEALGTIFDPQPSALRGNIHSLSDPTETVIGYITTTTMRQQRIFISRRQLVNTGFNIARDCNEQTVRNLYDSLSAVIPPGWPHTAIFGRGPFIEAYKVSNPICVDCRLRGGINVKPSFW
jgi:hypothetical protein